MTTHRQLLYHIVFSTKKRKRCLTEQLRSEIFPYMAATCKNLNGFALNIGGYVDHVHLLVRIPTTISVADFVGEVKASSSRNFNQKLTTRYKFGWQDGYGAFTVSSSLKNRVSRYIENQIAHHANASFEDEYLLFFRSMRSSSIRSMFSINLLSRPSGLMFMWNSQPWVRTHGKG